MNRILRILATVFILGFSATLAHAGLMTIDYNFATSNVIPNVFTSLDLSATNLVPDDLSPLQAPMITATASVPNLPLPNILGGTIQTTNDYVTQGIAGLGVTWSGSNNLGSIFDTDPLEIDGFGPQETLNLTWSNFSFVKSPVLLKIVAVTLIQSNDDVRILLNGSAVGSYDPSNGLGMQLITGLNIPVFAGDVLSFTVDGANDDFGLYGLRLQAQTISEPNTWFLIAIGALGLFIVSSFKCRSRLALGA